MGRKTVDLSDVDVIVPAFRRCWKRKEAPANPVPAARRENAPRRVEKRNGPDMMISAERRCRPVSIDLYRRRGSGPESEPYSESFVSE